MKNLKRLGVALLGAAFIVVGSVIITRHNITYAANTIVAANNQVITIATTDGLPVNAALNEESYSGDGNVILFTSSATNLPNASTNGGLYEYNIGSNTTVRVDVSTSGVTPNNALFNKAIMSETGRYVTFGSYATNLIDGTTEPQKELYKHDMQTSATTLVGAGYTGGTSQNWDYNLAVSNDGRFSLLSSRYLGNSYPNPYGIVYGDGATGTYSWTSLAKGGDIAGSDSASDIRGSMSCDGAYAAYQHNSNIQLSDLRRSTVVNLTVGNATSLSPIISCNGRYVLYATTNRTDITPTPTGMSTYFHLVRYDRITGQRMYIDSNSSGVFGTTPYTYYPTVNPPANMFIASVSDSGDAVFSYNGYAYLKHLSDGSGTLEPIAKTASGSSINVSSGTLTSDGKYIFFDADPYNLGIGSAPAGTQIMRVKTNL